MPTRRARTTRSIVYALLIVVIFSVLYREEQLRQQSNSQNTAQVRAEHALAVRVAAATAEVARQTARSVAAQRAQDARFCKVVIQRWEFSDLLVRVDHEAIPITPGSDQSAVGRVATRNKQLAAQQTQLLAVLGPKPHHC